MTAPAVRRRAPVRAARAAPPDGWVQHAACRTTPGDWYSDHAADRAACRAVCWQRCPVRAACLAYAMAWEGECSLMCRHGIWGGLDPRERHAQRQAEDR